VALSKTTVKASGCLGATALKAYTGAVRRLSTSIAVLVMFLMMLPALACAATSAMSPVERDCCRQMHGRCGDMVKQGCCQVQVQTDVNQLPSQMTVAPVLRIVIETIDYPRATVFSPAGGYGWRLPDEHSPPGLLIASSTVLRI
jgi:hypothetical protein